MVRRFFLLGLTLIAGSAVLFAQSNEFIDQVLTKKQLDTASAAYLALAASGLADPGMSTDQALSALGQRGWNVKLSSPAAPVTLGQYSYLLMRAFNISGGLFYRAFPGPRYAERELAYRGFITDRANPYRTLSGEEALRILGAVLASKEE
jgi:hypothetical protein